MKFKARAFKYRSSLTGLTIESVNSSSPISIGEDAFCGTGISGSWRSHHVYTELEKSSFENCTSLATLIIESGSSSLVICQSAFSGKLTIPDRVSDIGESSFRDCNKLTELAIEDHSGKTLKIGKICFLWNKYSEWIRDSITRSNNRRKRLPRPFIIDFIRHWIKLRTRNWRKSIFWLWNRWIISIKC